MFGERIEEVRGLGGWPANVLCKLEIGWGRGVYGRKVFEVEFVIFEGVVMQEMQFALIGKV